MPNPRSIYKSKLGFDGQPFHDADGQFLHGGGIGFLFKNNIRAALPPCPIHVLTAALA